MPDERAKTRQLHWRQRQRTLKRQQVTYWLETEVHDELNRLARDYGGPKQDAINAVLTELLRRYRSQDRELSSDKASDVKAVAKRAMTRREHAPLTADWEKTCQRIRSLWPRLTYLQIAETLNREGIPTKTSRGRWHVSTVKRVIEQT